MNDRGIERDPFTVEIIRDQLIAPIFIGKELIAFSVNKVHWSEVGGMAPGRLGASMVSSWKSSQDPSISAPQNSLGRN